MARTITKVFWKVYNFKLHRTGFSQVESLNRNSQVRLIDTQGSNLLKEESYPSKTRISLQEVQIIKLWDTDCKINELKINRT